MGRRGGRKLPKEHANKQKIYIGADEFLVPAVVNGTDNTPLPPSVEEAYRRKCIDLVTRTKEVEESNDVARVSKERLNRGIRKMRLERAFLLEMLAKRMKKTGMSTEGLSVFYESDSDGSSEGPPTPQERPTRTKKAHRRPAASTPPAMEYIGGQQQQSSAYQSMIYEQPSHQHESPYGPQPTIAPSNGHRGAPYSPSQQGPARQPTILPSTAAPSSRSQPPATRALASIPAPSAFAMFFESKYLSQPHKHSGIRSDSDLEALAKEHWNSSEHAVSRKKFEEQAAKQQARLEQTSGQIFEPQGPAGLSKVGSQGEEQLEGGVSGGVASDVEMSDADGNGGSAGFRSVN